ncbi:phosphate/phosphite/phosphonate ABC transporter substrate-binding protein [Pelagibius sp.]|uniref:phosphate/phosphite/phosphonate ABC transporter substrate-binding protein n=1 Tax=Pelagibius sp. TaxID=1931238 RepID=UPI002628D63E|nr:PhnD/SsuA/transferrin family substrate-binding protein [Pelagibius sp.]
MLRASLPMYDLPGLEAETDAWWAALAAAFRAEGLTEVPAALDRGTELARLWTASDLLFSQTCGYPLTHSLKGQVTLLATPSYACDGCSGGCYHSEILVRKGGGYADLRALKGARAVVNDPGSQSGYAALRAVIAPLADGMPYFADVGISGSHFDSMTVVAEGGADVCAIDCVTFALLARLHPELRAELQPIARSPSAPALPYITRRDVPASDLERLRAGLRHAFDDPALQGLRDSLLLADVEVKPLDAYDRIDAIEAEAMQRGYPEVV